MLLERGKERTQGEREGGKEVLLGREERTMEREDRLSPVSEGDSAKGRKAEQDKREPRKEETQGRGDRRERLGQQREERDLGGSEKNKTG